MPRPISKEELLVRFSIFVGMLDGVPANFARGEEFAPDGSVAGHWKFVGAYNTAAGSREFEDGGQSYFFVMKDAGRVNVVEDLDSVEINGFCRHCDAGDMFRAMREAMTDKLRERAAVARSLDGH